MKLSFDLSEIIEKTGMTEKLEAAANKLYDTVSGVCTKVWAEASAKLSGIFATVTGVIAAISAGGEKAERLLGILQAEENQAPLKVLKEQVFKLLRMAMPKKGGGTVVAATGDPYMTGKLLEVLAFFYPVYKDSLEVVPDFHKSTPEADIDASGRVYLFAVLIAALKVFVNKRLRKIYKDLKGVLNG